MRPTPAFPSVPAAADLDFGLDLELPALPADAPAVAPDPAPRRVRRVPDVNMLAFLLATEIPHDVVQAYIGEDEENNEKNKQKLLQMLNIPEVVIEHASWKGVECTPLELALLSPSDPKASVVPVPGPKVVLADILSQVPRYSNWKTFTSALKMPFFRDALTSGDAPRVDDAKALARRFLQNAVFADAGDTKSEFYSLQKSKDVLDKMLAEDSRNYNKFATRFKIGEENETDSRGFGIIAPFSYIMALYATYEKQYAFCCKVFRDDSVIFKAKQTKSVFRVMADSVMAEDVFRSKHIMSLVNSCSDVRKTYYTLDVSFDKNIFAKHVLAEKGDVDSIKTIVGRTDFVPDASLLLALAKRNRTEYVALIRQIASVKEVMFEVEDISGGPGTVPASAEEMFLLSCALSNNGLRLKTVILSDVVLKSLVAKDLEAAPLGPHSTNVDKILAFGTPLSHFCGSIIVRQGHGKDVLTTSVQAIVDAVVHAIRGASLKSQRSSNKRGSTSSGRGSAVDDTEKDGDRLRRRAGLLSASVLVEEAVKPHVFNMAVWNAFLKARVLEELVPGNIMWNMVLAGNGRGLGMMANLSVPARNKAADFVVSAIQAKTPLSDSIKEAVNSDLPLGNRVAKVALGRGKPVFEDVASWLKTPLTPDNFATMVILHTRMDKEIMHMLVDLATAQGTSITLAFQRLLEKGITFHNRPSWFMFKEVLKDKGIDTADKEVMNQLLYVGPGISMKDLSFWESEQPSKYASPVHDEDPDIRTVSKRVEHDNTEDEDSNEDEDEDDDDDDDDWRRTLSRKRLHGRSGEKSNKVGGYWGRSTGGTGAGAGGGGSGGGSGGADSGSAGGGSSGGGSGSGSGQGGFAFHSDTGR
jgi:uncharacterized membrane protein YgcG